MVCTEAEKKRARNYYWSHREECKANGRKYYRKHRVAFLEKQRIRKRIEYRQDPLRFKAYCDKYRLANEDKCTERVNRWRKANPDAAKEIYKKQAKVHRQRFPLQVKARQLAVKIIPIPRGKKCEVCEMRLAVNRHHPDYSHWNKVVFCCVRCHKKLDKIRRGE